MSEWQHVCLNGSLYPLLSTTSGGLKYSWWYTYQWLGTPDLVDIVFRQHHAK